MANMYNSGLQALAEGDIMWGTDTMYCALVTSSYTFTYEHDDMADVSNEITNTGYSAGGADIDTEATILDDTNDEVQLDSDNETWSSLAAGDQPYAAIIYLWTGVAANDLLLCYCALTTPPAPNGGDYTIAPTAEGWCELTK